MWLQGNLMKTLKLSILTLLFFSFSYQSFGQLTAVMQVSVEVISGAKFSPDATPIINLSDLNASGQNIQAGSFSLFAAPGTDIQVHVASSTTIKNAMGEIIEISDVNVNRVVDASGKQSYSFNGTMNNQNNINGHYQGQLTAVVEYL